MGSLSVSGVVCILFSLQALSASADGDHDDESRHKHPKTVPKTSFLDNYLSYGYYYQACPQFEAIVDRKIKEWLTKDYTLAAALIRLHFHDCSVRGCDGSVLLNHEESERKAAASKFLRGFEVINDIKSELEKVCPKKVSCADILTAASRDATVEAGGPFWSNPYGRKDGLVSKAEEANSVPMGRESVTTLIEFFQSMGLNVLDLVILSGAHTIGRSTCGAIQYRLYNFNGTGKPDPTLNDQYYNYLSRKCRWASEYVDLDATTPLKFDTAYYTNLQKKMGLLSTDQILYSDSRTSPLISAVISQSHIFEPQFAASMVKLGNVGVLTGDDEGEVRTHCEFVNRPRDD